MAAKNNSNIEPNKVTKPIQLLAAWLVGLIIINGSFLSTATLLNEKNYVLSAVLVLASVVNVPLFLVSIFLLQTKFRPEMQEDSFYSKYIDKKFGNSKREITPEAIESIKKQIENSNEEQSKKILFLESTLKELTNELEKIQSLNSNLELKDVKEKLNLVDQVKKQTPVYGNKVISLNQRLNNFKDINKVLKEFDVPVHELFGRGLPENFTIAFGDGFSQEEMYHLTKALTTVTDGYIVYANDEDEDDQYKNIVLIGSYGTKDGLSISNFIEFIEGRKLSNLELYKLIGK